MRSSYSLRYYFGNWLSNCRPLAHSICSPQARLQAAPNRSFLTGTMLLAFPPLLITMLPNNWCFFWGSWVYFHGHQSLKTALSILNLSSNGPNQHSTMVPFHVRGPSPQSRVLIQLRPCCWFWRLWQLGQHTRPQCTASVRRPIAWRPAWHQRQSPVKSRHPTTTRHLSLVESRSHHLTKRLNRYYSSGFPILLLFRGEPVHPGSPGRQSLPTMLRDSSRNLWARPKTSP